MDQKTAFQIATTLCEEILNDFPDPTPTGFSLDYNGTFYYFSYKNFDQKILAQELRHIKKAHSASFPLR
jgi:YHS domain-containing protein